MSCPRTSPPKAFARRSPRRAASSSVAPRSSTSTAASRSPTASKSLALRLEFRAAGPHPHRRGGCSRPRGDSGLPGGRRGVAPWLRSKYSSRAPPASPARWPPASSIATPIWSWRASHRAATSARGSTRSIRATACRWRWKSSTSTRSEASTARSSPTRTAPPPRSSRRCAPQGPRRRPLGRLPPPRPGDLRRVVRRPRRPRASSTTPPTA